MFCFTARSSPTQELAQLDYAKLTNLLATIDGWPSGNSSYSDSGWTRLILAARYIQGCQTNSVLSALNEYEKKCKFRSPRINSGGLSEHDFWCFNAAELGKTIETDGKILLLLRIVFNLPEAGVVGQRFYSWAEGEANINPDGTVNISWPISWKNGKPRLVSLQPGIQGAVGLYHPAEEYDYFLRLYPMRDLSGSVK